MGVQPDMNVKPQVVVRFGGGVVLMQRTRTRPHEAARWLRGARHRRAALRQPQGRRRRRFHRLARRRDGRPQACAGRDRARRGGLPRRAARASKRSASTRARRRVRTAQGRDRPDRRRVLRPAGRAARRARRDRHQRQDVHGVVARAGAVERAGRAVPSAVIGTLVSAGRRAWSPRA